jgi:hypothetical protein
MNAHNQDPAREHEPVVPAVASQRLVAIDEATADLSHLALVLRRATTDASLPAGRDES